MHKEFSLRKKVWFTQCVFVRAQMTQYLKIKKSSLLLPLLTTSEHCVFIKRVIMPSSVGKGRGGAATGELGGKQMTIPPLEVEWLG